jgi:dipeptidyl aminopeptidase/acylaminoacyl peptidase
MRKAQSPTIRELLGVHLPTQTWLSPDGNWMAHSESLADWERNIFRQRVILTDLVKKKEAFVIDEDVFDSGIKWSWDSKSIGYLTFLEGQSILRKVDCSDGSFADVACSTNHFTDFDWQPDSSIVAIAVDTECPAELKNEHFSVKGEKLPSAGMLVVDVETGKTQRFNGWDEIYNISGLTWSPSGDKIMFTAIPEPDNQVQWQNLLMLDMETRKLVRLTDGERAIFFPVWNKDGSQIAFSERRRRWDDLGGSALKIISLSDLSERVLLPQVEINCRIRNWNNNRILVSGQLLDRSIDVYEVAADSGECVKATIGVAQLKSQASASKDGRSISYIGYEEDRFPEVTLESEIAPVPILITNYHSQVRSWPKMTQQNVVWQTEDGCNIEGVLIDARSNSETDKHPLIVLIHGGSASTNGYNSFVHSYFELWNPYPIRQWNEQGISVFMPDYRGSSGYGHEFRETIANRRGELESSDILSGLDYLLADYGFDTGRIGVAGPSYGGYLTMLLAAKYPSRFAAASSFCGFVDARLMLYTSDANWETDDAWDPNKALGFISPLSYVSSNCPPMLLQTGDLDKNVNPAHSHAFYRILKKRGGRVKLVTYKNCGHSLDHPKQLLSAQEHNLEWFTRWL